MFIDKAKIEIKAGDGGNGVISYRREAHIPKGGPDGGNGGRGGDVIFKATRFTSTLLAFKYKRKHFAQNGQNGQTKNYQGKNGDNLIIEVPIGTIIKSNDQIICDLNNDEQEFLILKGGRGGRGNKFYANSVNRAPNYAENGEPTEVMEVQLEMKLLADVGLIGFPSVGKSSILSVVSAAKPKIAAYHFTTIVPNLGVVKVPNSTNSFVMADMPGLIKGASQGHGLGIQFLQHIERTKVLVHVVDGELFELEDLAKGYKIIREELGKYNSKLLNLPEIVVLNKIDIEGVREYAEKLESIIEKPIIKISTFTKENTEKLIYKIFETLQDQNIISVMDTEKILNYKYQETENETTIDSSVEGVFVIHNKELVKRIKMMQFTDFEAYLKLNKIIKEYKLDDLLAERGVQDKDTIVIGDFEFEYKN
jgi:GTP-binding protein